MIYRKLSPSKEISHLIECYWWIDSEGDSSISEEKIIPDGFPEIIWHYGEPYEIKISGHWELQPKTLLAGQLANHFYLRNTGISGMVGIKWKPQALFDLYQLNMSELVDAVIELPKSLYQLFSPLAKFGQEKMKEERLSVLDKHLCQMLSSEKAKENPVTQALERIQSAKGKVDIEELASQISLSTRSLERHFKQSVGLSPKFYSRIIRLNHVFQMVQSGNRDWADIVYQSGFYDQPHFIKNFKEFIGEDPTSYGFDSYNMANFHLRK